MMELGQVGLEMGLEFAIRWHGYLRIFSRGRYTFRLTSDDGSRLFIGGGGRGEVLLINNDGLHSTMQPAEATHTLF